MVAGSIHFAELYRSIGMVFDDQRGQGRVLRIETQEVRFDFQINEKALAVTSRVTDSWPDHLYGNYDTLSQLASPIA